MAQNPRPLAPLTDPWHFLGCELRRLRTRNGLSQDRLGHSVHVSGDLIAKIEKAERRPNPGLIHLLDQQLRADGLLERLLRAATTWTALPGTSRVSPHLHIPPEPVAHPPH